MENDSNLSVFDESTSAAVCFAERISEQVNQDKVNRIIDKQRSALARFEKTNEMLANCVALSDSRFEGTRKELVVYTKQLVDMKRDLDSIFRRVRLFKQSLSQLYPDAFKDTQVNVCA